MNEITNQQTERETQRLQGYRDELVERIDRAIGEDGTVEALSGLHLNRRSAPQEPTHTVTKPSFCVIAQRSKGVFLGNHAYRYDPLH